ncbi:glycoside hydrolase family 16 protein [Roseateles sp. YR242]|uniref:glycoside hydrolase family 16 protein n=1 Tax=Roseateles sp. YR242 TaxID=1855305 RepID=UPI0015A728BD|nr:glycoside hydrolase family 16 protein [Roseateles sp. YR242]
MLGIPALDAPAQATAIQATPTQAGSTQAGSTQAGSTQARSTQARSTQTVAPPEPEWFFDDFTYADTAALQQAGWQLRSAHGHPGIPGARWNPDGAQMVDDPTRPGKRLLRLHAQTDGTGPGTSQVQVCHQRKYLAGTYAARVRFSDQPVSGADGDPVIQTFYAVSPLRFDFDPEFSELDWEYLPNGGWGSDKTRLYGITWQTVRLDPWLAFNQQHEEFAALGQPGHDWHTLVMQVADGRTQWFVDGRQVTEHGGRNYPVVPMSINFNLWFSPNGPLATGGTPRVYEQDVDWVLHAKDTVLSPAQIEARVAQWRLKGVARLDQVRPPVPALENRCDF